MARCRHGYQCPLFGQLEQSDCGQPYTDRHCDRRPRFEHSLGAGQHYADAAARAGPETPTVCDRPRNPHDAFHDQRRAHIPAGYQLFRRIGRIACDRYLDELQAYGINWIRVWGTWDSFGNNVSAVDSAGNAREPYLSRLRSLVAECDRRGIVVDVTLARGTSRGHRCGRISHRIEMPCKRSSRR